MPVYMVDTDISSYIMKRSSPAALGRLQEVRNADICISVITKCELEFGVEVSPRFEKDKAALDGFLRQVEVLNYPQEAATHYAQIRAALHLRGTMIGAQDLFIASHARCLGLTLVTNNIREFKRVPGLRCENWAQ